MKMFYFRFSFLFLSIILFLSSCKEKTGHSFYYWKNTYELSAPQKVALNSTARLYIKVCDVVLAENKRAKPEAVLLWKDQPKTNIEYVPVVFLDQQIFHSSYDADTNRIIQLVNDLNRLIASAWHYKNLDYNEVQFDCDWTRKSRELYFLFLEKFKRRTNKKITATIRLDQVKNYEYTGVPPVDEGVVMAYNMGNIKSFDDKNSILSMPILKQYIHSKTNYPLNSKLALPIFSWKLLFRDRQFDGILRQLPDSLLKNKFTSEDNILYLCKENFTFNGIKIKQNDVVKVESVNKELLQSAERYIKNNMKLMNETIYFDLSSENLLHYDF